MCRNSSIELDAEADLSKNTIRSLTCKFGSEISVWKADNEELRSKIKDLLTKTTAEVAVWRSKAESLEAEFVKKAGAEVSVWKLDSEMSKKKLAKVQEELQQTR